MVAKTTPPVLATAWAFWGFSLNEWAAIFAIIYSALGIFFMLRDRFKKWFSERQMNDSQAVLIFTERRRNPLKRFWYWLKLQFGYDPSE